MLQLFHRRVLIYLTLLGWYCKYNQMVIHRYPIRTLKIINKRYDITCHWDYRSTPPDIGRNVWVNVLIQWGSTISWSLAHVCYRLSSILYRPSTNTGRGTHDCIISTRY